MALFGVAPSWKLDSILVQPEDLSFVKIDAVLLLVGLALDWITLELHAVWKIYRNVRLPQEKLFLSNVVYPQKTVAESDSSTIRRGRLGGHFGRLPRRRQASNRPRTGAGRGGIAPPDRVGRVMRPCPVCPSSFVRGPRPGSSPGAGETGGGRGRRRESERADRFRANPSLALVAAGPGARVNPPAPRPSRRPSRSRCAAGRGRPARRNRRDGRARCRRRVRRRDRCGSRRRARALRRLRRVPS